MEEFVYDIRIASKAGSLYGTVTSAGGIGGVTVECGLSVGSIYMAAVSKAEAAEDFRKKLDDGYATVNFAYQLYSAHALAGDVAEELFGGAQRIARSGGDHIDYLLRTEAKRRILDHQAFIRPWRWEDIRLPEPTAPWAF